MDIVLNKKDKNRILNKFKIKVIKLNLISISITKCFEIINI